MKTRCNTICTVAVSGAHRKLRLFLLLGALTCFPTVETVSSISHGPADFVLHFLNKCSQAQNHAHSLADSIFSARHASGAAKPICAESQAILPPESKKSRKTIPLFDVGFLQIMQSELFRDDCAERQHSSVTTNPPCYSTQRTMKAVIDYRRNRVMRGISNVVQAARDVAQKIYDTRHYLLAGAVGRCVAVSVMFPVDTIKTRLQMYGSSCCSPSQWSQALRLPIYNGVSSSLLGQVNLHAPCILAPVLRYEVFALSA